MSKAELFYDKNGNYFKAVKEGEVLTIYLHLNSESRSREIARVILPTRTLEILRSKHKHLFRKNESYGFNEFVIREGTSFDNVMVKDEDGTYLFPKELIQEKGTYLHFKESGFEKQIFLSVAEMKKHMVEPRI
jgi:hypothetical protein